jgi:hypothetical protein
MPPPAPPALVGCAPVSKPVEPPFYLSVVRRIELPHREPVFPVCENVGFTSPDTGFGILDARQGEFVRNGQLGQELADHRFAMTDHGGVLTWDDKEIAFRQRNSTLIWKRPLNVSSSPSVFVAGPLAVIEAGAPVACRKFAIDLATGTEAWRRHCDAPAKSIDWFNGVLLVTRDDGVEGWDARTGHRIWRHDDYSNPVESTHGSQVASGWAFMRIKGGYPSFQVFGLDGKMQPRAISGDWPKFESLTANGPTAWVATSGIPDEGGSGHTAITAWDLRTLQKRWVAEAPISEHADNPNSHVWVGADDTIFYYDAGNGLLSAFDGKGILMSSLGVADGTLVRTATGFVHESRGGVVEVIEPSKTEEPPTKPREIEGTFTIDGTKRAGIELLVGTQPVKTGANGKFKATVKARGSVVIAAHPPELKKKHWVDDRAVAPPNTALPIIINAKTVSD